MSTEARRPRRERTVRKVVSVSPAGLEGGQYRPLREADVLRIHQAALQVLERTGVEVMRLSAAQFLQQPEPAWTPA